MSNHYWAMGNKTITEYYYYNTLKNVLELLWLNLLE